MNLCIQKECKEFNVKQTVLTAWEVTVGAHIWTCCQVVKASINAAVSGNILMSEYRIDINDCMYTS